MQMLAIVAWLAAHGCAAPCAAGLIAGFEREAGPNLDPGAHSRLGAGLPGWAGPRRRRMMQALGARWTDANAQLGHLWVELSEIDARGRPLRARHPNLLAALTAQTDPARATELFFSAFQMPGHRAPTRTVRRARQIYEMIKDMKS